MAEWNLTLDQNPDDAFLRAHDATCRIGQVRQASSELRALEADLNAVKIKLFVSVHATVDGKSIVQASTVTNADNVQGDPWS